MKKNRSLFTVATAIALGMVCLTGSAGAQALADNALTLSAATKKSTPARQRGETGQIACTVVGCHRIPPGCHPEMGYNWDGIPTGFDIVVCAPARGRRG